MEVEAQSQEKVVERIASAERSIDAISERRRPKLGHSFEPDMT